MTERLTEAQRKALEFARDSGTIMSLYSHPRTILSLVNHGFLQWRGTTEIAEITPQAARHWRRRIDASLNS